MSRDDPQPGDVINFYSDASHTGIYVGDGMVVHASTFGQPVKVVPLDGAGPFYNAPSLLTILRAVAAAGRFCWRWCCSSLL